MRAFWFMVNAANHRRQKAERSLSIPLPFISDWPGWGPGPRAESESGCYTEYVANDASFAHHSNQSSGLYIAIARRDWSIAGNPTDHAVTGSDNADEHRTGWYVPGNGIDRPGGCPRTGAVARESCFEVNFLMI